MHDLAHHDLDLLHDHNDLINDLVVVHDLDKVAEALVAEVVERGGLRARRMSRNVWKLSRAGESREGSGSVVAFSDGFRRRL